MDETPNPKTLCALWIFPSIVRHRFSLFDQTSFSTFYQELKSNKTLLHLAVKEGNIELVRFLLKIPLPEMQDFVNMKVCLPNAAGKVQP